MDILVSCCTPARNVAALAPRQCRQCLPRVGIHAKRSRYLVSGSLLDARTLKSLYLSGYVQHARDSLTVCASGRNESESSKSDPPQISGLSLVGTSALFYTLMTVVSILLGNAIGYDIKGQLVQPPLDVMETAPYFAILAAFFTVSTVLSEVVPPFRELKNVYQRYFVPVLKTVPLWGIAVLAIGAGIGEEVAFRGFLQTWLLEKAAGLPASTPASALAAALVTSSVIFGAAHAITPFYAFYATCAGVIFGVEYLRCGLPAAAFTHALYDFVALVVIIQLWKGDASSSEKS